MTLTNSWREEKKSQKVKTWRMFLSPLHRKFLEQKLQQKAHV